MIKDPLTKIYKRFFWASIGLIVILVSGTFGYWFIGGKQHSISDCTYMTVVTISTIGYHEIIDFSDNVLGRIFTMCLAFFGIGTLTYIFSNFTALVVEGDLKETFKRRKMDKFISSLKKHYIVCGIGRVGFHIVKELEAAEKSFIIVETNEKKIKEILTAFPDIAYIHGDATEDNILLQAGILKAKGIFAATDNDNGNLVISMTAKHLNPVIRIVARCYEPRHIEKMKKAGADSITLPAFIGGMRMSSEMIKPTVVSFLDILLRNMDDNLIIEEIPVPDEFIGKPLADLGLKKFTHTILITVKTVEGWIHTPSPQHVIKPDSILIFLTSPKESHKLKKVFS